MVRAVLFVIASLFAMTAHAERISSKNFFSEDNASVYQRKHILNYEHPLDSRFKKNQWGGYLGSWVIDEPAGEERFDLLGISGLLETENHGELELDLGLVDSDDWSVNAFSLYYRQKTVLPWYYEFSFESNIVDSILAIENQVRVNTYSASLDIPLAEQVTGVVAGVYQSFSDENSKSGVVLKGIYTFSSVSGLNISLVYKQRDSGFTSPYYYSPDKQQQVYIELAYARAVMEENFIFRSRLSAGNETINSRFDNNIMAFEASLNGWFRDKHGVETKLGCSNSGDVFSSQAETNYRYCYSWLNYIYAF